MRCRIKKAMGSKKKAKKRCAELLAEGKYQKMNGIKQYEWIVKTFSKARRGVCHKCRDCIMIFANASSVPASSRCVDSVYS